MKKKDKTAAELEPLPGGSMEWTAAIDAAAKSLVEPPKHIPFFTGILLDIAEKAFQKELRAGRLLSWSGDLGLATGALEKYIEKGARKILEPRLIYLLRMQVSYAASCPFAIDVNSSKYTDYAITEAELSALQGKTALESVETFSGQEKVALTYAVGMTRTPIRMSANILSDMRRLFSPKQVVAVAALAAKVNFWARFLEAMRIKPAGYSDDPLLRVGEFGTLN